MYSKILILIVIVFCGTHTASEGILSYLLGGKTNEPNSPIGSSAQSESKSFSQGINLGLIGLSTSITSSKSSARSVGFGSANAASNGEAAAGSRMSYTD